MCHMPNSFYQSSFDHPGDIAWWVQIVKTPSYAVFLSHLLLFPS
jgi:hypothetical protein